MFWRIVNLGCHGFYNHDLRAIYELVNLDVVVEELQRGILVLCCLRPNWPESILSVAFVQVASFVKVGWFVQREFAGISFWQTEFVTYFVLTERV